MNSENKKANKAEIEEIWKSIPEIFQRGVDKAIAENKRLGLDDETPVEYPAADPARLEVRESED